jgi:hypothetical protein
VIAAVVFTSAAFTQNAPLIPMAVSNGNWESASRTRGVWADSLQQMLHNTKTKLVEDVLYVFETARAT